MPKVMNVIQVTAFNSIQVIQTLVKNNTVEKNHNPFVLQRTIFKVHFNIFSVILKKCYLRSG